MLSHALAYILLVAAWLAFIVAVMIVQDRAQKRLEEPRPTEPREPDEPLEAAA
jgi:hypothetical protein